MNLLAGDARIYCLREKHTSFEAFAISENAGIAMVMNFYAIDAVNALKDSVVFVQESD